MIPDKQQGFSLPDALIAMLIFSISITVLMNYHQTSVLQFQYISERQNSWQLAYELLDIYPDPLPYQLPGFQHSTAELNRVGECLYIQATVKSPRNINIKLARIICI